LTAAVIAAQVVAFVLVAPFVSASQFSPARELADAVRHHHANGPIVSDDDFDALTLGGYLDRPVYSVARHAWTTYFVHDERQARGMRRLAPGAVAREADALARRSTGHAVLVVAPRDQLPSDARVVVTVGGLSVAQVRAPRSAGSA